ncbi:hypothetical protein [Mucilaginibacter glaciei]|uniref:Uncharacterized protein n=1 Tax=Mucilaginibacter glaciei TaxID=2772109 RepID=A0A926NQA9_9SPHI|nr:hypothetical protein [Mucilaginibacter glaciei]MBD1392720.1 hypothetical protein [Mucilaginibacter glaciei]
MITCIILAIGLVLQELRRANKHWLLWRVLAIVVACVGLACIALPLSYQIRVALKDKHKTTLLTEGFDVDSLDKNAKQVTFDEDIKKAFPHVQLITPKEINKTDQLHIYGYGLTGSDLQQLAGRSIVFHQANTPAGTTNLSYTSRLKTGDVLTVQGSFNNTSKQKVKLVLKALNTGLDSVIVAPKSGSTFTLTTLPKTSGRVVYTLTSDGETQGSLPVEVNPVKTLKVLMLSASPDFESKFLKNWLSGNGYAVASRAAISKDKFTTEFINIPQFPLDRISASTLNKFDVLIGDLSVLSNLSDAESAALKQEVTDNGLGVIVKADSAGGKSSWLQRGFPVDRPSGKEPAPATLLINGAKSLNKLGAGNAYINYQNGTQPLVTGAQNHILANSALSGSGKIVFTTLNNTFSWMLAGNKADYTTLWSALITKAARKSNDLADESSAATLPVTGQPTQLTVLDSKRLSVNINGDNIASIQHLNIPFEWDVLYRPTAVGWQFVHQNGNTNWFYAYPQTDWLAIQAVAKISATKNYEMLNEKTDIVTKQIQETVRINVPKIYFYILLLAACTFLWAETKIS